jgi:hypothetical protein
MNLALTHGVALIGSLCFNEGLTMIISCTCGGLHPRMKDIETQPSRQSGGALCE